MDNHSIDIYSKHNNLWNLDNTNNYKHFIGGLFPVSNTSNGYHGLLKQWWDFYNKGKNVLIISESSIVKKEFNKEYPEWNIDTTDMFFEDADIKADICNKNNPFIKKYDLIINQATIEHVYNPFQAMNNLCDSLNANGILITHTHPPSYRYHQFPRDYFRFMKDWWYDLPNYIDNIELLELYMFDNKHVFTCYKKI